MLKNTPSRQSICVSEGKSTNDTAFSSTFFLSCTFSSSPPKERSPKASVSSSSHSIPHTAPRRTPHSDRE